MSNTKKTKLQFPNWLNIALLTLGVMVMLGGITDDNSLAMTSAGLILTAISVLTSIRNKRISKRMAITYGVLGLVFLMGETIGPIIGIVFIALAIVGLLQNKKPRLKAKANNLKQTSATMQENVAIRPNIQKPFAGGPQKKPRSPLSVLRDVLIVIVLLPLAIMVIAVAIGFSRSVDNNNTQENKSEQQTDDQAISEEQRKKETEAAYKKVLAKYAPIYCANHQDITVNEPDLHKDGWPMADNKKGITEDECEILIGLLYLQRNNAGSEDQERWIKSIAEGKVAIGMTKIEVVYSWGSPNDINRTITGGETSEQWVFGNPIYGANYVYLDNGFVTSIQN